MHTPYDAVRERQLADDRTTYRRVGWTLLGGLALSIVVMAIGLFLVATQNTKGSGHAVPLNAEVSRLVRGDPEAILDLGILLLFATPIAGVVVAGAEFARQRDGAFVAIAAVLLIIIGAGFVIALR